MFLCVCPHDGTKTAETTITRLATGIDLGVIYGVPVRGVSYPHFLDWGIPYPHFSGRKSEEFAVTCCQQRLNYNKTVFGQGSARGPSQESSRSSPRLQSQMIEEGILPPHSPPLVPGPKGASFTFWIGTSHFLDQRYAPAHRYSPSWVLPSPYSHNIRSKGQRSRSQSHKAQKHIEGGRVAGMSLHSIEFPASSYYFRTSTRSETPAICYSRCRSQP